MSEDCLRFDPATRTALWRDLAAEIEAYLTRVDSGRVAPVMDPAAVRALLAGCTFDQPVAPSEALHFLARGLAAHQTHTPHRRYFGLFNPAPTTMGVAADALVAAFNPQLAAWSHSPLAIEIERHLIRAFGGRFGYPPETVDGTFASGGAEANHTALLCAITHAFPDFPEKGLRGLPSQPVFYLSSESHHSFLKAAKLCGLGAESVRSVETGSDLRMIPSALGLAIARDRESGAAPFLVVGTAGTTNAGAIDPLAELARIAAAEGLWFHTDAAWGGAAALVDELRPLLDGIEHSHSITFDAHKWLSVPMGAGIYLTRDPDILSRTFRTETAYMPREARGLDVVDPHLNSMQWSRRFTGAKLFLSLLAAGWDGYAGAIRHQTRMGVILRQLLASSGWRIENDSPLPVVCFSDPGGADPHAIAMKIVASGQAWISTTLLKQSKTVLRACITNFLTAEEDIEALVAALNAARR
jgi:glutamate/tyrosine decarboxylase-like PLP-dependent enzyme